MGAGTRTQALCKISLCSLLLSHLSSPTSPPPPSQIYFKSHPRPMCIITHKTHTHTTWHHNGVQEAMTTYLVPMNAHINEYKSPITEETDNPPLSALQKLGEAVREGGWCQGNVCFSVMFSVMFSSLIAATAMISQCPDGSWLILAASVLASVIFLPVLLCPFE